MSLSPISFSGMRKTATRMSPKPERNSFRNKIEIENYFLI
jgi:hypothetical protein